MKKIYTAILQSNGPIRTLGISKFGLLFLGLFFFLAQSARSQVSLTASAGTLSGTYTTLKAAFDAINAGTHQGVISINITGNTTETATAQLNGNGNGSALYTSVSIQPTANVTVTGAITGALVRLNGTDNVTINGLLGGTRQLTFNNTTASSSSAVLWVSCASATDGANNNAIRNCNFNGASLTTTLAGIGQSGTTLGTVAEVANNNNTYENNQITTAQYGIAMVGPTGNETGNVIKGNLIGSTVAANKIWFRGIFVSQEQNIDITENTIQGVNFTSGSGTLQGSGIYIGGTISGGSVTKNKISDIRVTGFWGCNGIQLNSSSASTGMTIANNFIWDVAAGGFGTFNSVDDNGAGIAVNTGGAYRIYFNSINLNTNQGSGITAAIWLSSSTTINSLEIINNIFSNQQTLNNRYAIYSNQGNTIFAGIDFNDYYTTGTNLGFLSSNRATLGDWQTATGQDNNSVSVNPSFFSATDLHLFFNSPLDGLAAPIGTISDDIDGDARDISTPDIGADEFTPPPCTSNNGGTASASPSSICATGTAILSSTGYDYGVGITYQWEVFSGSWQPIAGETNPLSGATGTISATTQFRLRVQCNSGPAGYSNVVTIAVNNPTVTGTTPGSRCGVGTVNLGATGSNIKWYAAATGGTAIGSGNTFTTPVISANTTYYASASVIGASASGGKPDNTVGTGGNVTFSNAGLVFNSTVPFTIVSVKMYPTAAGTATVEAQTSAGTTIPGCSLVVNFTGAAPTGVVVPLGFTVPAGTAHRLVVTNTPSTSLYRNFSGTGVSYPYTLGALGSITGGWLNGSITNYYYFYDWQISEICEGTRTAVLATVTTPPSISASASPTTICSGNSSNLNVTSGNGGYTYQWTPGPLSGAAQTVSPISTTTYTVTATDNSGGANNGCVNVANVTLTVNSTPSAVTVNPPSSSVCSGQNLTLTASGGIIPNQTALAETFETFPLTQFSSYTAGGTVTVSQNTTYYQQGTSSVWLVAGNSADGGIRSASDINLSGYTSPVLTFSHICSMESSTTPFDYGYVQYSTDGGSTWTTFPASSYLGSGTIFNTVTQFSTRSYSDWISSIPNSTTTLGTAPATALWKNETIDLTPWQGTATFRIRFRYTTDVSLLWYGWLIDNIRISGNSQAPITWSGVPNTQLYFPTFPTAYAGQVTNTVVTQPTVNHVYTATAAGGGGCNASASTTLTVAAVAVGVSISASPSNNICAGTSVTFTATPTNGGTTPFYTWFKNGSNVASGIGLNTYTSATWANGDQVYCTLLSNIGGCATNNPATSNTVTMTVNPIPTVNITGGTTVCNGAPPTVLTANAAVSPGSIATYQWFLGGVSQGAPSASSTFNATVAGDYTVTVVSAAGCSQTSAIYTLTLPTYTITATAGPNGTISPAGAVTVNCGDNITFTITPNPFYGIQDVLVDGVSVGAVGTYTFNNVTTNHTISATFFIAGCPNPPTANAGGPTGTFCANQTYTLAGSVGGSATAGIWSGGGGTYNPNISTLNAIYTPSAAEISAGTVTLTLTTNNPSGAPCVVSTSSITLTIKEIPVVSISGVAGFCPSGSTTLTANASINPAGPLTYAWLFNGSTPLGSAVTQNSTQGAGTYQVTATGNGCSNTASVAVVAFTSPTVSISGSNVICTGSSTTLNANFVAGSGTISANAFIWKRGGVVIGGANTSVITTATPGTYTVIVTDDNGCVSAESAGFVLSADNSPLNGIYTISGPPASCTNYVSFASAISDLNTRGISGNVRFLVDGGYTETAPTGGLALGSVLLNGNMAGRTLSFEKGTSGANPKIFAYSGGTATPTSAAPDGIFSIRGTDNVSINSIDLQDNNVANPATMEYGYGLFKASATDGVQNVSIENCTITLNRINNAASTAPMMQGSVGILVINSTATAAVTSLTPTAASGANSNNRFYGNTIQNCNYGIVMSGYTAPYPYTLGDTNNDVGGTSSLTGNNILNFGGGGANQCAAIYAIAQYGTTNFSYNTINNNNGSGVNHTGGLRGIWVGSTFPGGSATINNNTVDLKSAGTTQGLVAIDNGIGNNLLTTASGANVGATINVTSTATMQVGMPVIVLSGTGAFAPGTTVQAIINATSFTASAAPTTALANGAAIYLNSNNSVSINNNTISATYSTATTGFFQGILNVAGATTVNINANTVTTSTATPMPGTGAWTGISNTGTCSSLSMTGNTVQNSTITSTGGLIGLNNASTSASVNVQITNNIIQGITKSATGSYTASLVSTSIATNATMSGNLIRNNTILAGASTAVTLTCLLGGTSVYTYDGNTITNNAITGISGTAVATLRGISNVSTPSNETVTNNAISRLYVTGTTSGLNIIQGINSNTGSASVKNIANNRVDTLYTDAALNAVITGINTQQGARVVIAKNKISHLIPGGTLATSIARGVWLNTIAAASTASIHNNMINLDLSQAFAPAANSRLTGSDNLVGIAISPGSSSTDTVAYNTIRLAGAGSGASFGSSAISQSSSTCNVLFLNNILSNETTPGGTSPGFAVALRRGTTTLGTIYAAGSDNNNFWAGTASASRLLYFDGTNAHQTLAALQGQAGMSPREANSQNVQPVFVSTTDLHLNPASNCSLDGSGKFIPGAAYASDIDTDPRDTNVPDIGADEHTGSGGSGTWKGYNTNWNDPLNWCGVVPTSATNVVIPAGKANYPLIVANNAVCNNINITTGGSVTITGIGKLAISGTITNTGTFTVSDGTIELAGSSAQTIPASVFVGNNIKNLVINNATVNLGGALNLTNKLTFVGSNRTFATAGNLTLKSSATRTASIGDITNNGTNSGNQITGDVTVERFASARRAWRLLSVPTQHNLQTIKQAWQENQAANAATPAGFGINIPSDRPSWSTDGFDQYTPNGGPSVKTYNPATNGWVGIISTVSVASPTANNGRFVEGEAYMTFVRGDRTVNTFPQAATTTVLREKGALRTGNFGPIAVGANQFKAVGNPYASAIDFTKLTKSNLQDVYYLWDPQIGTLGGFQTFLGPAPYLAVPGGGSYTSGNNLIESGSGFFIRSNGAAGSVSFTEPSKADTNYLVQRLMGPLQYLKTNIYQVPANGSPVLMDGVLNRFDPSYSNDLDNDDAIKLGNFTENLGLKKDDKTLVVESKQGLTASDTIQYQIGQVRAQTYQFEFIAENISQYGLEAFLEDKFLNTKTPVNMVGGTVVPFTIINEPGSYASDRFRLVFKMLAPVPVTFTNVKAEKSAQDILVSWKVENESQIDHYEVEKSADGRSFSKIGDRIATGNGGATVQYNWLDRQVLNGYNYYRIRSIGLSGEVKLSEIVKINVMSQVPAEYTVYPNPVREDGIIQVSLDNAEAGNYVISLYNNLGQVTYRKQLSHGGGSSVYSLDLGKELAHGQYRLELRTGNNEKRTFNIIY